MSDWAEGIGEYGDYSADFGGFPDSTDYSADFGGFEGGDSLFALTSDLDAIIAAITAEATTSRETAELPSFGEPGDIKGEANDNRPASTGESSGIADILKKAKAFFGFENPTKENPNPNEFQKLALTGAAYGIAGLGAGYSNAQKLKQERELMQQKLDTDRLLAQSQASIAQQKMQNMDFSKFNFQKPGLINSQLQYRPVKDPYPRRPS